MKKMYLDDAATTRVYPEVVKEMDSFFLEEYGNPSSLHEMGERAEQAMNKSRGTLAAEINAKPHEITFTSGGTESNNLAIQGLAKAHTNKKKIIISSIEHPSIMETCEFMEKQGYDIVKIPVDNNGLINLDILKREIDNDTLLVSVIHANNISGVVQNLEEIGKICALKNILFHTDAVQSFGKLEIDVNKMNISMLSASAHKIGGPKGIGLLYVRENVKIQPIIFGGGQEKSLRSGTENIPGIVGFAKALKICKITDEEKIRKVRNKFIAMLGEIGGNINSPKDENGMFNIINVSFPGIDNETLVVFLSQRGIYVSAGSACDSKKSKEDYVLRALGLEYDEIKSSIRISLGESISEEDVESVVREIDKSVRKLKI